MTAEQWAAVAGVAAGASALFAFLAWRVARSKAFADRAYLDVETFRRDAVWRMAGHNADHWEILTAEIIWPLTAQILVNETVENEHAEPWEALEVVKKPIGRCTRKLDQALFSSSASTLWLVRVSLKTRSCERYSRIIRIEKNI